MLLPEPLHPFSRLGVVGVSGQGALVVLRCLGPVSFFLIQQTKAVLRHGIRGDLASHLG